MGRAPPRAVASSRRPPRSGAAAGPDDSPPSALPHGGRRLSIAHADLAQRVISEGRNLPWEARLGQSLFGTRSPPASATRPSRCGVPQAKAVVSLFGPLPLGRSLHAPPQPVRTISALRVSPSQVSGFPRLFPGPRPSRLDVVLLMSTTASAARESPAWLARPQAGPGAGRFDHFGTVEDGVRALEFLRRHGASAQAHASPVPQFRLLSSSP